MSDVVVIVGVSVVAIVLSGIAFGCFALVVLIAKEILSHD